MLLLNDYRDIYKKITLGFFPDIEIYTLTSIIKTISLKYKTKKDQKIIKKKLYNTFDLILNTKCSCPDVEIASVINCMVKDLSINLKYKELTNIHKNILAYMMIVNQKIKKIDLEYNYEDLNGDLVDYYLYDYNSFNKNISKDVSIILEDLIEYNYIKQFIYKNEIYYMVKNEF